MPFGSLWLPVVASAVAVWLVSAVLHMAFKYHKADYKALPDEESVAAPLRKIAPAPGLYYIPYCTDFSQLKDPAVRQKFEQGPVAMLTMMRNGAPGMGKNLLQWLGLCFAISLTTGYIARHTLTAATPGLEVLRITGAVAFAAYGFGYVQDSIWKAMPWSNSIRSLIDALVYGVTTGLVFRFLWPAG